MKHITNIIKNWKTLRSRNVQCLLFIVLLTSCQSIEQLTIDYMEPAKVSFPDELKKVGIVNNVPEDLPNRLSRSFTDTPNVESNGLSHTTNYYNGLTSYAMESLAHAIADHLNHQQQRAKLLQPPNTHDLIVD